MQKNIFFLLILIQSFIGNAQNENTKGFSGNTIIWTPKGQIKISQLSEGDTIYTINKRNQTQRKPIIKSAKYPVSDGALLLELKFDLKTSIPPNVKSSVPPKAKSSFPNNAKEEKTEDIIIVGFEQPLYSYREKFIDLNLGDKNTYPKHQSSWIETPKTLVQKNKVLYNEDFTYDILPDGETGVFWANNVITGSSLFQPPPPQNDTLDMIEDISYLKQMPDTYSKLLNDDQKLNSIIGKCPDTYSYPNKINNKQYPRVQTYVYVTLLTDNLGNVIRVSFGEKNTNTCFVLFKDELKNALIRIKFEPKNKTDYGFIKVDFGLSLHDTWEMNDLRERSYQNR